MRTSRLVVVLCEVIALGACSETNRAGFNAPVTALDSAGVEHVSNRDVPWNSSPNRWTLDTVPAIAIGEGGDSSQLMLGISGHLRLADSTIVLINGAARELRFYSANGKFIRAAGRKGQGPGEFSSIGGMFSCGRDSIIVADYSRRISVWSSSGKFIRESQQPVSAKGFNPTVVGVASNCASLLVRDARPMPLDQQSGRHLNQLNWRPLDGVAPESLVTFPGIEATQVMYGGRPIKQAVVYSNQPEFAIGANGIVIGMGDAPEFRVYDLHGKLKRVVRWKADAEPVTEADRASYSKSRAEYIAKNADDASALPPIDQLSVAKTKPYYAKILVDDEGDTWLCQCPDRNLLFKKTLRAEDKVPWLVFDPGGNIMGTITIPGALNVQRIGRDEVGGVWYNDDEVASLRIYRIRKPGA